MADADELAPPWDAVISETEHYRIMPTKGALVSGWLLVVSKTHHLCAGALDAGRIEPLESALSLAARLVADRFGPVTIFEHGPSQSGTAVGCGVDHLHFHVVPLPFSLLEAVQLLQPGTQWQDIRGIAELRQLHAKGIPYAFVKEPNSDPMWCVPPVGMRQMLRRAIAKALGVPELFDYAVHPHTANVVHTVQSLSNFR